MKLKFIPLLSAVIAPLLMSSINSQSLKTLVKSAETSSVMIAVDEDFFVDSFTGGEWVHFTGQLHLVTIFIPTDPVQPGDPYRVHTNVTGLKGVGATSGLTYNVIGASSTTANFTPGSTNNLFNAAYRLLPPNPIQPLGGLLRFGYNVSFDSFGKLTNASANIIIIEG